MYILCTVLELRSMTNPKIPVIGSKGPRIMFQKEVCTQVLLKLQNTEVPVYVHEVLLSR